MKEIIYQERHVCPGCAAPLLLVSYRIGDDNESGTGEAPPLRRDAAGFWCDGCWLSPLHKRKRQLAKCIVLATDLRTDAATRAVAALRVQEMLKTNAPPPPRPHLLKDWRIARMPATLFLHFFAMLFMFGSLLLGKNETAPVWFLAGISGMAIANWFTHVKKNAAKSDFVSAVHLAALLVLVGFLWMRWFEWALLLRMPGWAWWI